MRFPHFIPDAITAGLVILALLPWLSPIIKSIEVAGLGEIQLQRAALPRTIDGDPNPPVKVQPRTVLLREGLDQNPPQPYFVHQEEVPRAGARLVQTFQRTRWTDGTVYTWLRVRKQTGRSEASSGLGFDELVDVPFKKAS